MDHADSPALEPGSAGHVHRFNAVRVPPQFGHSYLRCAYCGLSKHLTEHDPATCEMCCARAPVAATVNDEGLTAMFDELYNCYTASKCAASDREEFLRLKGMAEAYQDAARRCREWPVRRRNDGSVVAPSSPPAQQDGDNG